eukprot:g791.t1
MKLLCLVCCLAFANAGEIEDIVAKVNAANAGWTAAVPERFASLDDVRQLCGTYVKGHPKWKPSNLPVLEEQPDFVPVNESTLPTNFDLRTAHANCTVIGKIRDQSACGSCWAFGSVESFEDRRCIATGEDVQFSPNDVGACSGAGQGCSGGQPTEALQWMVETGVVTGGDYPDKSSGKTCKPYQFAPCAHHVPATSKYPACPQQEYTMRCVRKCIDTKYPTSYTADRKKGTKAFSIQKVATMMGAIMQKGTVSVAFTVYADFETYKSGVYKHTTGAALGGHAVSMIGWGEQDGQKYWLVKNSWNEQWGDGGTFKIVRGTDECGIEDEVAGINF